MTSKRAAAAAQHLPTYYSGKQCRRGHDSDRYTSNGMCIECVKMQNDAFSATSRAATRIRNQALMSNLREHKYMVHNDHDVSMRQLAEIFQYAPPAVIEHLKHQIATVHEMTPNPKVLTYEDLIKFIKFDGARVLNRDELNFGDPYFSTDPEECLHHNGYRYPTRLVSDVLLKKRLGVAPL